MIFVLFLHLIGAWKIGQKRETCHGRRSGFVEGESMDF